MFQEQTVLFGEERIHKRQQLTFSNVARAFLPSLSLSHCCRDCCSFATKQKLFVFFIVCFGLVPSSNISFSLSLHHVLMHHKVTTASLCVSIKGFLVRLQEGRVGV